MMAERAGRIELFSATGRAVGLVVHL